MTKRLLLVLTEFPPSFGGMQTHALELSRWLHDQGYYVEVATYRLEQGPAELPVFPFQVHRVLSRVAYQANLRMLMRLGQEMNADLIYSSTVYYGELSSLTGIRVICRSAGNDVMRPWIAWPFVWGSRLLSFGWVERQLYRRWKHWQWPESLESILLKRRMCLMKNSAKQMERIFANSDYTHKLLTNLEIPEARLLTLSGGVDFAYFSSGSRCREKLRMSPGDFYLLTACRMVEKKGLDVLIVAMKILVDRGIDLRLIIAGEGKERCRIEAMIADLNLSGRIELLGYLTHEALRDYLHAVDAFALSSKEVVHPKTGLKDAETMGRVLCEASACGLPLIATASGGIPSIVEDGYNGLLAQPGNAVDLADKIEQIWNNRQLAHFLGANGQRRARDSFDWPVLFATHQSTIEKLIQTRSKTQ